MQPLSERATPARPNGPERAPIGGFSSVSACLEHDHRVMAAILTDVDVFARDGDFRVAASYFAQFRARLATHIGVEEELVFPLYERATGNAGPTAVMRREHEVIRGLLARVGEALARDHALAEPLALLEELALTLGRHDEKEECVIYPAVDACCQSAAELAGLTARVEAFLEGGRP